MPKLVIVRHAQVNIDFSNPASEWSLSEEGIKSARELALTLPMNDVRRIYHSPEKKAEATARVVAETWGLPLQVEANLRELHIPPIHPTTEFVRRVGAYLEGHRDPEFEDWTLATNRIVHCVESILHDESSSSAAIVSHGRILCVLMSTCSDGASRSKNGNPFGCRTSVLWMRSRGKSSEDFLLIWRILGSRTREEFTTARGEMFDPPLVEN